MGVRRMSVAPRLGFSQGRRCGLRSGYVNEPEPLHQAIANGFKESGCSGDERSGTAPWGRTKIYINAKTGQWHDKLTGEGGNSLTWMTRAMGFYRSQMNASRRRELAELRYSNPSIHFDHDVGYDPVQGCFVVPHRDEKGYVRTIKRYRLDKDKYRLFIAKGTHPYLFNAAALAGLAPATDVWVCESEWDALAVMGLFRLNGKRVVAVSPGGSSSFKQEWVELLRPFRVVLAYDNDDAGAAGELKAFTMLQQAGVRCRVLRWDADWAKGWDLCKFEGWGHTHDVRPAVRLAALLDRLHDSPRLTPPTGDPAHPAPPQEKDVSDCPTFAQVNEMFNRHFRWTTDLEGGLKVVLAVALAARVPGIKLFMFLIGEPGSGKTELVDKLDAGGFGVVSSTISPRALVSGLAGPRDPSLLLKLNGKAWVVKDYTEILSKHTLDQEDINSTLRGAFDGYVRKDFGNGVSREFRDLHFSHIAAVTPIINGRNMAALGERYLKLHLDPLPESDQTEFLMEVAQKSKDEAGRQAALRDVVGRYLARRVPSADDLPAWPERLQLRLAALVQVTALVRTQVDRDQFGERELRSRPAPERPTRLFKQLLLLGRLIAFVEGRREVNEAVYALCERVGFDTAVGFGLDAVQGIVHHGNGASVWELTETLRLPRSTVERTLENLRLVGLVSRRENAGKRPPGSSRAAAPAQWVLSRHLADLWTKAEVKGDHAKRLARYRGGAYSESKKSGS